MVTSNHSFQKFQIELYSLISFLEKYHVTILSNKMVANIFFKKRIKKKVVKILTFASFIFFYSVFTSFVSLNIFFQYFASYGQNYKTSLDRVYQCESRIGEPGKFQGILIFDQKVRKFKKILKLEAFFMATLKTNFCIYCHI